MNERFANRQHVAPRFDFRCQEWIVGLVIGAHAGFIAACLMLK